MSLHCSAKAMALLLGLACPVQTASVTYDLSGAFASSLGLVAGQFIPGPGGEPFGQLDL